MFGYLETSDTSQTDPRCLFAPQPAFFPRTSWLKRVQAVWSQWLFQPWPKLWRSHLRLISPFVQSRGPRYYLDSRPLRKDSTKISPLPLFPYGSSKLILCYEFSDKEALTLHQVKGHDVKAFAAPKTFDRKSR